MQSEVSILNISNRKKKEEHKTTKKTIKESEQCFQTET